MLNSVDNIVNDENFYYEQFLDVKAVRRSFTMPQWQLYWKKAPTKIRFIVMDGISFHYGTEKLSPIDLIISSLINVTTLEIEEWILADPRTLLLMPKLTACHIIGCTDVFYTLLALSDVMRKESGCALMKNISVRSGTLNLQMPTRKVEDDAVLFSELEHLYVENFKDWSALIPPVMNLVVLYYIGDLCLIVSLWIDHFPNSNLYI
jgi:hypothetical protein